MFTKPQNKVRRNSGIRYMGKNEMYAAKAMKSSCNYKRLNCCLKIPKETSQTLLTAYWQLVDIDKQKQFIFNRVTSAEKNRSRGSLSSRKNNSLKYYFYVDDIKVKVYKTTF